MRMFSVEVQRSPGDLGVSVVLTACNEADALNDVQALYPEYFRGHAKGRISILSHVHRDWETGQTFLIRDRVPRFRLKQPTKT